MRLKVVLWMAPVLLSCASVAKKPPEPPEPPEQKPRVWWRWSRGDAWTTEARMPDKIAHFTGGYAGTLSLLVLGQGSGNPWLSPRIVVPSVMGVALAWEVKDAFYNCENYPKKCGEETHWPHELVGDGFSWRDMVASWAGVWAAWGLMELSYYLSGH